MKIIGVYKVFGHIENNFTVLLECLGAELAISIEEKRIEENEVTPE